MQKVGADSCLGLRRWIKDWTVSESPSGISVWVLVLMAGWLNVDTRRLPRAATGTQHSLHQLEINLH